jgi:hypothetical protein
VVIGRLHSVGRSKSNRFVANKGNAKAPPPPSSPVEAGVHPAEIWWMGDPTTPQNQNGISSSFDDANSLIPHLSSILYI